MSRKSRSIPRAVSLLAAILLILPTAGLGAPPDDAPDLEALYKIKHQGFQRSRVMETLGYLTDVHGPRLTGSPGFKASAEYAIAMLTEWGMENARLEPWGEFGCGWSNQRYSAHVVSPQQFPLFGSPKAWTLGTQGRVRGEAVIAVIESEAEFERFKGQIAGKYVLVGAMPDVEAKWEAPAHRFTDDELAGLAEQPDPAAQDSRDFARYRQMRELRDKINDFFREEGVAATFEPSSRVGSGGTVFVGGGGTRQPDEPRAVPQVVLTVEHYGRIWRTLKKEIPVTIEMEIENTFHCDDTQGYNILAEIPGTDLADEVVMLGGHFDSWHAGTGAVDNAAGSAVMMEAVRIIREAGLQPRRTIRIGLWDGEEQGLLGSRGYVKGEFADPITMELLPAHEKLSAYFNVDNGTGAIRGVYLQNNERVAPIFEQWMKPFHNIGMTTLAIRNTGGTDHQAFDGVGLPGFQFIQDPVEYRTRSHHANFDTLERIQVSDMMKNSVIVASFVYHTAMRDDLLPRKPLPAPQPDWGF